MEGITFDSSACAACGLCARSCPFRLIGQDTEGKPFFRDDGVACMECGHCAAVCPNGAITVRGERVTPIGARDELSFIRERRSYRRFRAEAVPFETIERAIDATRYAPTGKNAQPVEWSVITDRGLIARLARGLLERIRTAPELALRYKYVAAEEDPIFWDAPALVVAHGDPKASIWQGDGIVAATAFDYASQALGLGTCWSGTAMRASEAIGKAARIPEGHVIHAVLMVGFPDERFVALPPRKPAKITRI
ncbi:MAG TPA: nitroreductase family protein [Treponemataceae bacterium]|nr:nitroreductase family protein [Treponemataceae bacterium]